MAPFFSCIIVFLISLLSALLALAFLYVLGSIIYFFLYYCKELIQGSQDRPPIAGTILHLLFNFNSLFDYHTDTARKHPTFRLVKSGYSEIFTTNPANVEHILKNNFQCYTKGKYNYDVMKDLLGDGIFVVDGEKWKQQRKLASYEFSTRIIKDYSSLIFRENAAKLANKISKATHSLVTIDMQDLLMKTTLDSIFRVGFGVDLGTLSGCDDAVGARFSKAFDDANQITFRRYADLFWKLKRLLNIGVEADIKKNIRIVDDFVFSLIQRKREMMKNKTDDRNKEDILSRFILAGEKEPGNMTDKDLRDIILNFLIAGKDTSANTLSWFFYMMCKHPDVQEKVVMEINESTGCDGGDTGVHEFASGINDEALDKMHYLHAAMTETLRLYPAVPADGKYVTEDDVLPDGFKTKKGDGITYMGYAMGRMKYIWGDDAEEFRPERWINNGSFSPESPYKFVSFHAGPRLCLGKEFAYRQMKIVAAVLLHFFRFKLVDGSKNVTYRTMFTLHMDKGLPLYAIQRIISGE